MVGLAMITVDLLHHAYPSYQKSSCRSRSIRGFHVKVGVIGFRGRGSAEVKREGGMHMRLRQELHLRQPLTADDRPTGAPKICQVVMRALSA